MRPRPVAGPVGRDDISAAAFRSAVAELEAGLSQQNRDRPEISFDAEPPPRRLAPHAAAIAATVRRPGAAPAEGTDVGWGRFVLLCDPAGQPGWAGPFRIIAYLRADLEPDIAADPLIGHVGWTWLTEALDAKTLGYRLLSGTVTRVVTEGFGTKQDEPVATEFELRASWSPAPSGAVGAAGADTAVAVTGAAVTGAAATGAAATGAAATAVAATGAAATAVGPAGVAAAGTAAAGTAAAGTAAAGTAATSGLGIDGHAAAWCDALCAAAGLPPLVAGVSALAPPRRRRPT
jgi:hypothetical protein